MSVEQPSAQFRALHERPGLFVMPNPWDAGTAYVLEAMGFEAIATASAALATTLGRADDSIGADQSLVHARMLVEASSLPVNGDLRDGFGREPQTVATTVRRAIEMGLAGCSIEDIDGPGLYDRTLALERIEAAVEARDAADPAFVLTARCEAFLTDHEAPLAECLERLPAMAAAGADVVYACGMQEAGDIKSLVDAVEVPVNVLGGTGPEPLSTAALRDLGVKRVSLGPRLMQAAAGAFLRAAEELREDGTFGFMADAANLQRLRR